MKKASIIISTFLALIIIFSGTLTVYSEETGNNYSSDTLRMKRVEPQLVDSGIFPPALRQKSS